MPTVIKEDPKIEKSIKKASKKGLFRHSLIRPPRKMLATGPKIVLVIPIGDKDDPDIFVCPKCKTKSTGVVKCGKCGKVHSSARKLRRSGLVAIEWLLAMWQIVPPLLCSMSVMVRKGVLSGQARNEMTYQALKGNPKYIMHVDDDNILTSKTIYDLHNQMELDPDCAVLTGVYVTREHCQEPIVYKEHGQGAYWDFSIEPGVTEEIFACGAGVMMVRAEALREVKAILGGEWWADVHEITPEKRTMWGHDVRFCKRIAEAVATGKTSRKWTVKMAGWIQSPHFDIDTQTLYTLPKNAPCFKNANTQGYWDYRFKAEGHDREWGVYRGLYEKIADIVPRHADVVDIGCGIGILLEVLAKKKQVRGYGIDFSPMAISMLNERMLEGECCDLGKLKLKRAGIEKKIVVCTETLEHLDDERLDNTLKQSRLAQMAIFSVPRGDLKGTPKGEHVRTFTNASLQKTLGKHFDDIEISQVPRPGNVPFLLAVCKNGKQGQGEKKVISKRKAGKT